MKNILYIKYHHKNIQNKVFCVIMFKKYFGLYLSISISWKNSYNLPKFKLNKEGLQFNFK